MHSHARAASHQQKESRGRCWARRAGGAQAGAGLTIPLPSLGRGVGLGKVAGRAPLTCTGERRRGREHLCGVEPAHQISQGHSFIHTYLSPTPAFPRPSVCLHYSHLPPPPPPLHPSLLFVQFTMAPRVIVVGAGCKLLPHHHRPSLPADSHRSVRSECRPHHLPLRRQCSPSRQEQ